MGPKDRILLTLNHEQPDRIPIDLGGSVTSVHVSAYEKLLKQIGVEEEIWTIGGYTSRPNKKVLDRFQVDTRYIYPIVARLERNPPLEAVDCWGIKRRFTGYYWDVTADGSPLSGIKSADDVNAYSWPSPEQFGYDLEGMIEQSERLSREDYAIVFPYVIVGSFAHSLLIRGYQQFLIDLIIHPKIADAILENISNIMINLIKEYIQPIGKYLDVVFFGDDLGTQTSLIISPQIYRRYVKPRHRKIVEAFRSVTNAKIIIHSDGSIAPLIDDFVEVGISGINPVQVSARDMDSRQLKERFGDRVIFWGGIDTQRILPFGTPEDVRQEVRLRIDHLSPHGGYVLSSVHNIQPLTPPQNIVTMFDEAIKYGSAAYKVK